MLTINVQYVNIFAEVPKKQQEVIEVPEHATVQTLIDAIGNKYGIPMKEVLFGKAGKFVRNVFVNGVSMYFLQGLDTKLKDRDEACLSPR